MTEEQFQNCLKCLNRKRGVNEKENICNIKGHQLLTEDDCAYFDLDKNIVIDKKDKLKSIRPNEKRAKYAIILIGVILFLEIVSIISSYLQLSLLKDALNGIIISEQLANNNDSREQIIGILYTITFIISSITFIQWFRRAYYNLNIRTNCNHSEGWASGSWFVPIISLYRPYQIMKELWDKTSSKIQEFNKEYIIKSSTIIGVWWFLWIVSNYIGKYALKKAFKAESIEDYINMTITDIGVSIIGIPLAICAILIIKEYSKKEIILDNLEKNNL